MKVKRIEVFLLIALFSASALATTNTEQEIKHLFGFIEASSCTFVRNKNAFPAKKAVSHVERKYNYFIDEITSAEDFIRLSASKSTMSNKPYHVICDGQKILSSAWLNGELQRYRQQQAKK